MEIFPRMENNPEHDEIFPQMENNPGGLREGEGGKAGALLLPAAQVNNIIIVVNIIIAIIATSLSCAV